MNLPADVVKILPWICRGSHVRCRVVFPRLGISDEIQHSAEPGCRSRAKSQSVDFQRTGCDRVVDRCPCRGRSPSETACGEPPCLWPTDRAGPYPRLSATPSGDSRFRDDCRRHHPVGLRIASSNQDHRRLGRLATRPQRTDGMASRFHGVPMGSSSLARHLFAPKEARFPGRGRGRKQPDRTKSTTRNSLGQTNP